MDSSERPPRVCAVVLNWNGLADTLECLKALRSQQYDDAQVMVVDNGSRSSEADEIEGSGLATAVVRNRENLSFAGGSNVGIRSALEHGADYIWLLNNDTRVDPDRLTTLVRTGEAEGRVGLLSPVIYDHASTAGGQVHRNNRGLRSTGPDAFDLAGGHGASGPRGRFGLVGDRALDQTPSRGTGRSARRAAGLATQETSTFSGRLISEEGDAGASERDTCPGFWTGRRGPPDADGGGAKPARGVECPELSVGLVGAETPDADSPEGVRLAVGPWLASVLPDSPAGR
jgi:hypothetical protein